MSDYLYEHLGILEMTLPEYFRNGIFESTSMFYNYCNIFPFYCISINTLRTLEIFNAHNLLS